MLPALTVHDFADVQAATKLIMLKLTSSHKISVVVFSRISLVKLRQEQIGVKGMPSIWSFTLADLHQGRVGREGFNAAHIEAGSVCIQVGTRDE